MLIGSIAADGPWHMSVPYVVFDGKDNEKVLIDCQQGLGMCDLNAGDDDSACMHSNWSSCIMY